MKTNFRIFLKLALFLTLLTGEGMAAESASAVKDAGSRTNLIWGKATNDYQISLSVETNQYQAGKPITLKLIERNLGTNKTYVFWVPTEGLYDLEILYSNKVLFPTKEGKRHIENIRNFGTDLRGAVALMPGGTMPFFYPYPLTDIYDLKAPGVYQITAIRRLTANPNQRDLVRSNTIKIIIHPP